MLRAAMIMMLCCVSDAFVLQPAASRALAPARHSSVAQMLLPTEMLLPMTSLAEAGQAVAMKETPWALIIAGCVVTTLSAGFPVYATAITSLVTPLCTHPCVPRLPQLLHEGGEDRGLRQDGVHGEGDGGVRD